ncbi:unnamed protein product [Prunus armeniaca]
MGEANHTWDEEKASTGVDASRSIICKDKKQYPYLLIIYYLMGKCRLNTSQLPFDNSVKYLCNNGAVFCCSACDKILPFQITKASAPTASDRYELRASSLIPCPTENDTAYKNSNKPTVALLQLCQTTSTWEKFQDTQGKSRKEAYCTQSAEALRTRRNSPIFSFLCQNLLGMAFTDR